MRINIFPLLCLLITLASTPTFADDAAAWMFDPSVIVNVDLALSDEVMAALIAEPLEYVPATFAMTYGDRHYGPWDISLKLKGGYGSFRPIAGKAAFKLKFPSGSRPDGLKKLTLNNMVQDYSKIHEAISYELFRAMNVAAPRTGYASVTVNGEPYGLYLNVETLDNVSLARWYPETQHLYEGEYGNTNNPLDPFNEHYEVDEGDADNRDDLAGLLTTAQDLSPGWYERMSAVADIEQMTRMWATEAYIAHDDGYSYATNNYYLHADGNGLFTMLPWGTDQTLSERAVMLSEGTSQNPLLTGCIQDPICFALYSDAFAVAERVARSIQLTKHAREIGRSLRDGIAADPKMEHPKEWAYDHLSFTTKFLRARRTDINAWAATLPRAPRSITAESGVGTITLEWSKPSARALKTLTGHIVEYRREGELWQRVELDPEVTTYTIYALDAGQYEVRVRRLEGTSVSISLASVSVTVAP